MMLQFFELAIKFILPSLESLFFPLKPVKFTTRDGRNITLKQGWHEPENLQVMKGSDNVSKGNRILPEQYEAILQRLNPQDKIDFMEWYRLKGFYD